MYIKMVKYLEERNIYYSIYIIKYVYFYRMAETKKKIF